MILVRMKLYPVLFCGLSALFTMESKSVSISDISNYTSAVPLEMTVEKTHHLTAAHGSHNDTEQQPTVDSINSPVATVAATNTGTTAGVVAMNTSNNTSSSRPTVSHISTVTPADTTKPSQSVNKTEKPTEQHQPSAVTSAATAATTSETEVLSKSNLSSTVPDHSTGALYSVQQPTSSSVSSTSASSTITPLDSTSQPSPLPDSSTASLSDNVTERSNTSSSPPSPPPPPASQPTSTTDTPVSSTGQNSTSEVIVTISSISTTAVSTSQSTAVFIPKTSPVTTAASATTRTTAPCGTSQSPSSTVVPSCTLNRGVISKCLTVIASLAGLATVFMVSTIVLCTKLSTRKYRVKTAQQETEMMCISSLLPERNYTYARQRNPVSNGVLVIPSGGDSDDDEGDNFTLRSFLPDNDRYVSCGLMMLLIGLSVVFWISSTLATPRPFQMLQEGSADEDDPINLVPSTSTPATGGLFSDYQTTPGGHAHVDADYLTQVVKFLQENLLFILVGSVFLLIILIIICGAVCMSRRRKVNSYYPSSFPSKMYVDQRDKTGGAKPFHDVPEKPAPEQQSEPVDSCKQLQADIMRAAKSLRTANKSPDVTEGSDPGQKITDQSPEDDSKADGSILDKELSNVPEEKELCQLSDNEAAAASGSCELNPPEETHPEESDSQEPRSGSGLRPSSLHIHTDSATLQLIAGEKTAF
ncbi:uncharacterized protein LOC143011001 [Genypterus blacodes]|uniref:uncharacterized protein LOC143011001 n=1 Tax=Genypterus blacodes TaxID=154954 RepID=UPI003F76AD95